MIMAVQALLGHELSLKEADELTGFVDGRDTWPYKMMLSLVSMGIKCRIIEISDPTAMSKDPVAEISRVYTNRKVAEYIISETNLEQEKLWASECLNNQDIDFEIRAPSFEDITAGIESNCLPLVGLDYGILHNTGKYEGHLVVVSGFTNDEVEIFDPGPPGDAELGVPKAKFMNAVHSPRPESGMVIFLSI